jgi:ATP-dependent DNA ligase
MLSNPFNENLIKKIEIKNYTCEYKWDGIRAQITVSNNGKIY